MSDAYRARLERAHAWSDRDQADEAYRRGKRAEALRARLPEVRMCRDMDRANREQDAAKKRSGLLYNRRDEGYRRRFAAIVARIQAEHKIKPAGKSMASHWRYQNQINAAVVADSEYMALQVRKSKASHRIDRIRSRGGTEAIMAGVLMRDDRATRRAKVAAYRAAPKPSGSALDNEVKAIKPVVPIKGQLELFQGGAA